MRSCSTCGLLVATKATCDEVAEATIDLVQGLIDGVERELGDTTVETLLAGGEILPSVERYEAAAAEIDEHAANLRCTSADIAAGVAARAGELDASSPIGRFIVEAVRTGRL